MSDLRSCAKRFGGLTFIYTSLPTFLVVYIQRSNFHVNNVFCVVIAVKKYTMSSPGEVVFSYFVLHSSKIPLVFTTKVTHLRSLVLRQLDGINCAVRRVYLTVVTKLSRNRVVQLVKYGC